MPAPWHWPRIQLPERPSGLDLKIAWLRKRMKYIVSKSLIAVWAPELTGPPQTTNLWLPRDQPEDRKCWSPETTTLSWFWVSSTPVIVQHLGLLHGLSNCTWMSCCLQRKRRTKVLGQRGGMQLSCLVREEHSWREKSILKSQGHGGRADDPLSILWITAWCPSATPAGRKWHPRALQISGHAGSLPEVPP